MELNINNIPLYIINLKERTDRLNRSITQINNFFRYNKHVNIIEGIKHTTPMVGIAMSHLECIKDAKKNNYPYILIVEDDIKFTSDKAMEYASECFRDLPQDFNILLGGLYSSKKITSYNEYWNKTMEFSGTHFYIVNQNCYDRILEFKFDSHIDRWLANDKGGCLNTYVVKEFFAIQFNGYSDNVGMDTNYDYLLSKFKLLS